MLSFHYTITDAFGIHARLTGALADEARKFDSRIILKKDGKAAEVTNLMAVMGLGVKYGQTVEIEVSGKDEILAYKAIKAFFEANL